MCLHIASIKATTRKKDRFCHGPFPISTSWLLILAGVFQNELVAVCSTALRSANEKNAMGGHVTVPCSFKMTQHVSTTDWPKFL